ncbi:MAG: endonuclease III [Armatimonadota bacterium]|nr:endonuclease III [Armatimonadota bacterium]MDR7443817.1 endonuclease III [Armatimonadota bacterium]MDR7569014.1 endonuclease III [Armatimonadota bacterium]MDR7613903.1 endonuclease III [Armatimonadota bacterium]
MTEYAPSPALRRRARTVDRLLEAFYGPPRIRPVRDPVGVLVRAVLSQNTSDRNSDRAFTRLRERLRTWRAVRDAPLRTVEALIRPAGLSTVRARRIRTLLRALPEAGGEPSLDFLRSASPEEARAWLLGQPGIGPKTAAIVLLFGLRLPAFPVDTHVYRVTRRVGLVPSGMSREAAHGWMEALVPPERYAPFHLLLVRHGREICRAHAPRCTGCPLRRACAAYVGRTSPQPAPPGPPRAGL